MSEPSRPAAWMIHGASGMVEWLTRNSLEAVSSEVAGLRVTPLVPAPPEGAPSYSDLAEALRDSLLALDSGFITRAESRKRTEVLLSRLPKESEG